MGWKDCQKAGGSAGQADAVLAAVFAQAAEIPAGQHVGCGAGEIAACFQKHASGGASRAPRPEPGSPAPWGRRNEQRVQAVLTAGILHLALLRSQQLQFTGCSWCSSCSHNSLQTAPCGWGWDISQKR